MNVPHRKAPGGERQSGAGTAVDYGVSLTAGTRWAGGERLPLGRPGERPQGFGTLAGLPSCARTYEKPRRTRAGVRRSGGSGRCQGKRTSATKSRAKRSWTKASTRSQVQRSAAAGARSLGVVHLRVCLKKRKVCSIA